MCRAVLLLLLLCSIGPQPSPAGFTLAEARSGAHPQCFNIVAVGDSITMGFAGTNPFPINISNGLGTTSSNQGVGGAGWFKTATDGSANLTDRAHSTVDPLLGSVACTSPFASAPILVLYAGLNDICDGFQTGAQDFALLQSYINARIAAGWSAAQMVVVTMISNGRCPANSLTAEQTAYDSAIVSNAATIGYSVARVDLDPNMGCLSCSSNTSFFSGDNTHPNNAGYQILANLICLAIPNVNTSLCPAY